MSIFWGPFKSIFELTVNLGLVHTKLDTELGLAQPHTVRKNKASIPSMWGRAW